MEAPRWHSPPTDWQLGTDDLHVWAFRLDRLPDERERFWQTLTEDEQDRAGRFYFDVHRHHYVGARGLLRLLLANYLGILPGKIQFEYGHNGKPQLAPQHRVDGRLLKFNLSHADKMGLIGICWKRELGVDIEKIRPLDDGPQIAKRFFSEWENEHFFNLPESLMPQAFFNCWTRKEAFIKAIGDGLTYPLDKFDVTLVPGEPARLVRVEGSKQKASHWHLMALDPEPGFSAALIVEQKKWRISCFRWPDP